ncbi:hypothetical protein EJ03DRAFT_361538 [Teratosphaeria nubilosa]|uniref:Uncharacterized protein n=1 Tax=Teratosphaeria nubilosa TaxID=161662 RepID=A0A6G1LBE7_9PEZI|nr:hypothetical protein EJ03DRAFT_361538 [Teratosphaeria nubilosa]
MISPYIIVSTDPKTNDTVNNDATSQPALGLRRTHAKSRCCLQLKTGLLVGDPQSFARNPSRSPAQHQPPALRHPPHRHFDARDHGSDFRRRSWCHVSEHYVMGVEFAEDEGEEEVGVGETYDVGGLEDGKEEVEGDEEGDREGVWPSPEKSRVNQRRIWHQPGQLRWRGTGIMFPTGKRMLKPN